MSNKNYDQREDLYKPDPCANCGRAYNLHSRHDPPKCPIGKSVWFPAKVANGIKKIASDRTDSADKDAQISEQIRVNRELREQLAEALSLLEVIARRYEYRLDKDTHDHIRKTLDPASAH